MTDKGLTKFLEQILKESEALRFENYMAMRDWVCQKVIENYKDLLDKHFFIFMNRADKNAAPIFTGYKIFNTFKQYMDYGMEMPGDVPFCGFPGEKLGVLTFGFKCSEHTTAFISSLVSDQPKLSIRTFRRPTDNPQSFNPAEFFSAIQNEFERLEKTEQESKSRKLAS